MNAATLRPKAAQKDAGFTMVEVILSVMILTLLSGALFSLLSSVLDTRQSMHDLLKNENSLIAWENFFRSTLQELPAESTLLARQADGTSFSTREAFTLEVINAPLHIGAYAEYRQNSSYYLEAIPQKDRTLSLELVPYPQESALSGPQVFPPIILLTGIQVLEFEFYDAFTDQWEREWLRNNQKPHAIRCRIELISGERQELLIWIPHA